MIFSIFCIRSLHISFLKYAVDLVKTKFEHHIDVIVLPTAISDTEKYWTKIQILNRHIDR